MKYHDNLDTPVNTSEWEALCLPPICISNRRNDVQIEPRPGLMRLLSFRATSELSQETKVMKLEEGVLDGTGKKTTKSPRWKATFAVTRHGGVSLCSPAAQLPFTVPSHVTRHSRALTSRHFQAGPSRFPVPHALQISSGTVVVIMYSSVPRERWSREQRNDGRVRGHS